MTKIYRIELDAFDLGQLLDGLAVRAEAWEKTAEYHRCGVSPAGFMIEECNDANEALRIATQYHSIISKIETQREAQS